MSNLATAAIAGIGLVLTGFWLGACYGYARRLREEREEHWQAMGSGALSQSEYTEWLMSLHDHERRL